MRTLRKFAKMTGCVALVMALGITGCGKGKDNSSSAKKDIEKEITERTWDEIYADVKELKEKPSLDYTQKQYELTDNNEKKLCYIRKVENGIVTYEKENRYDFDNEDTIDTVYERWYDPEYVENDETEGLLKEVRTDSDGESYVSKGYTYEVQSDGRLIIRGIEASDDEYYEYDEKGNPLKIVADIGTDDEDKEEYSYEYDSNNNIIKETGADSVKKWQLDFEYYVNGNCKKSTYEYFNNNNEGNRKQEIEYDEKGHVLKSTYLKDGEPEKILCFESKYTYGEDGNYKQESQIETGAKSVTYWDKNGNEILYYSYDEQGKFSGWREHSYDIYGNETSCISWLKKGYKDDKNVWHEKKEEITNEYDDKGRIIKGIVENSGAFVCEYED